ncbi:MAG: bifunctional folylpolyglutamate synthase/dihydrofolate synthase [Planctomycetes bacterium]|nr:bifunctional folylpolyglutamate synthase/dihydrofolate synthase [Planctomycetota bacterium]
MKSHRMMRPFRAFEDVMAYLCRFTDYERMTGVPYSGRAYNVRRMRRFVKALGHPERAFRSVHIAGTKGKGSTAIMTDTLLRAHGLRTGLYTSPHLVDLLERIQVDGRPVSRSEFVAAVNAMRGPIERLRPTFFEIMTAAAFVIFKKRRVDCAVLEVGLGGRLDATNVVEPAACAITRIDYDHTDKLGTTLAAIAGEKAGILKRGVPVVTSETRATPLGVIARHARRMRAPLTRARTTDAPRLNVLGEHQRENAAVAIELARHVTPLDRRKTASALRSVRLPGRLDRVRPGWIIDSAHNPFAMRATAAALPRARRRIVIFGASKDKDWRAMLRALRADLWILTRADNPRAAAPAELARHAKGRAIPIGSVERALALARKIARKGDLVLVTGSFYVAGEAYAALRRR